MSDGVAQELTQSKNELSKKSTFGHFMLEAENVIYAKEAFKDMVKHANLNNISDREQIIKHAKAMSKDEVYLLFSDSDNFKIGQAIIGMEKMHDDIIMLNALSNSQGIMLDQRIRIFENSAYHFLAVYSSAQHNAKLGLQTQKEYGEIEKLCTILNVRGYPLTNSAGVKISPEMLLFAAGLVIRTVNRWDNVITIDAMPGTGKTTFDYALTTTMIDIYKMFYGINVEFSIDKHVIVTETREYCNDLISKLPRFSILMFIEAGNQFSSKKFYDDEQHELVNTVERIRFHGLTMNLEWNTIEGLDKTIRDRRATCVVSLEQRGKAIVRGFNLNPSGRGLTKNPKTKGRVAISAEAATGILELDALKAITIPIYELPEDTERLLNAKKDVGKKMQSRDKRAQQYYEQFLISLPDNIVRITSQQFEKYSLNVHQILGIQKLAKMISENIGLGRSTKLFIGTSMSDANEGYIEVNQFIQGYIRQLKAQYTGRTQFELEKQEEQKEQHEE
jgi:hypothetical protein